MAPYNEHHSTRDNTRQALFVYVPVLRAYGVCDPFFGGSCGSNHQLMEV